MLEIQNISKKYLNKIILHNINFNIPDNSITGIIGPNGAGKSTLLKILTGFLNFDTGAIYYNSQKLELYNEKKYLFTFMPEQIQLYPDYYVYEFIDFIHKINNYRNLDVLNILQLPKVMNKKIKYLSKGFHQRLKLYFALCNKKKIVVLDEPLEGFDPIQSIKIIKLIKSENKKGRTFIISVHQLFNAEKLCNYFVLIDEGEIIVQGNLNKLKKRYGKNIKHLEDIFIKALK